MRQIRASLTQSELLSLSGNNLKSVGCAEKLLNFYFQVLMQIQVIRRSIEHDESKSNQVLLVNKQLPEDASEIINYQTTICMYFPEMPSDLLKRKDETVIFDEQYTPFLLEIELQNYQMNLSQREYNVTD